MSEATDQATQLGAVLGEGVDDLFEITDDGTGVAITPIKLKQFSGILRCLKNFSLDFTDWKNIDYFSLLETGGDNAIELIAEAITHERDPLKRPAAVKASVIVVGGLDLLQTAKILGCWFQVNKDFFVQNQTAFLKAFGISAEKYQEIQNSARELWGALKEVAQSEIKKAVGPESSSSSSPTDTVSTTSAITPSPK